MQFKAAGRVMVLATFAACLPTAHDAYKSDVDRTLLAAPTPTRQVAAVGVLTPHPWKVGQWATYRTPGRGYETLSVVGVDVCGTWIMEEVTSYEGRIREFVCLREPTADEVQPSTELVQMMIVQINDRTSSVIDFKLRDNPTVVALRESEELRSLVAHVLPATWQGDTSLRETIDVPAGHFEMAVRNEGVIGTKSVTSWAHPDVPFDGVVWIKQANGDSFTLLAYGESCTRSMMPELAAPTEVAASRHAQAGERPKYRDFVGLGATSSWITGLAGESASGASGIEGRDGIAMTAGLELIADVAWSALDHSPDPTMKESTTRFALGFQWRPFAKQQRPRDRFSRENFYVLADLGYARLDRTMDDTRDELTSGFAAGAGAGWTLHLNRGLALDVEVSDHALFFTNDDITAHNLAATVLADIFPSW